MSYRYHCSSHHILYILCSPDAGVLFHRMESLYTSQILSGHDRQGRKGRLQRYFTRRVYQRCQLDCNHSYLQRLTYLKIESLELRRIYLDLAMVHKSIRGLITADINQHFSFAIQATDSAVRTRGLVRCLRGVLCAYHAP